MSDNEQETQRRLAWHAATVSWGQLIVALATMVSLIVIDRLSFERRVTIIEERQAFAVAATLEINRKLEAIQTQLSAVLIEVTRHEANTDRILNGPQGLRAPRSADGR